VSRWQEFDFERRIRDILRSVRPHVEGHHFGRPYLTSYQIAIEFARRYPGDVHRIGLPVGGLGVGGHNSLAQYLAGQLSRAIRAGDLNDIEGAFLSDMHLAELSFGRVRSESRRRWLAHGTPQYFAWSSK
jgi:hypothetical protein